MTKNTGSSRRHSINFITRTAILLALTIAVQQFKTLNQFITGPLVNAFLILAVLAVGLWSGVAIAVLSPIAAVLINPAPIMQLVPQMMFVIAIGNLLLVIMVSLLKNKFGKAGPITGMLLGAILKTGFLWLAVSYAVIPIWGAVLKDPQKIALTAMFSYNQLITALIGSALSYIVWLRFSKALEMKR